MPAKGTNFSLTGLMQHQPNFNTTRWECSGRLLWEKNVDLEVPAPPESCAMPCLSKGPGDHEAASGVKLHHDRTVDCRVEGTLQHLQQLGHACHRDRGHLTGLPIEFEYEQNCSGTLKVKVRENWWCSFTFSSCIMPAEGTNT